MRLADQTDTTSDTRGDVGRYCHQREMVLGDRTTVTLDPDDIAEKLAELAGGKRRAAWLMRQALRRLDRELAS